jgi:hypothetical protein
LTPSPEKREILLDDLNERSPLNHDPSYHQILTVKQTSSFKYDSLQHNNNNNTMGSGCGASDQQQDFDATTTLKAQLLK